ncbi:bis(5'-nucleosyl)-tetraphosphatase PrpE [Salipaludibacillus aurantiacus]|uniref:Protein phosphatase n=1 Tax=Salipaludibacillus aurantiacus TaxID=1601833 RepID=A0A1H9TE02_9BACI|nr:bis(5'-nucleosyl)-tetraphosphatase PrpE [Salipaludibacillus aurantiacus]SER95267.1 protein phosphatase [Salipaludibacillus aurantiacus]
MKKFDIIGDIHGCHEEMTDLLKELGYSHQSGKLHHSDNRVPVFLGDLTDRGPASVKVMEDVADWVLQKEALYCPGNHCNKLYRYLSGRNVMINNGLETTVEELKSLPKEKTERIANKFKALYEQSPLYLQLDANRLIVAHAGIRPDLIGKKGKVVRTFVLYGDITGEKHADGRPVRRDWAAKYNFDSFVVYGHTPVPKPRWKGSTVNIDTGCIFGGQLSALRWPEKTVCSVPSNQPYLKEKFQSFD